ncbi:MAG: holo-ACP synthase [Pseudomonadota bacterium]
MIFGIGTDLVQVSRIAATYERFGERFARHLLMDCERELFEKSKNPLRFLAMRFAAKEALVKALGTGFANGMWIRDVGYIPDAKGRPQVRFSDRGARLCKTLGAGPAQVSLTDETGLIVAFAVIENAVS